MLRSAQRILVPFFFFGLLNVVFFNLSGVLTIEEIGEQIILLLKGAQKWFIALQLWFLAALFCTQVVYHMLNRVITNRYILLGLSVAAFYLAKAFPNMPPLYYHLNTVPAYLVFFAAGDVFFRRYSSLSSVNLRWLPPVFAASLLVAFLIYSGGPTFFTQWGIPSPRQWWVSASYQLLMISVLFTATIAISLAGTRSALVLDIGRNTLILVGLEVLIKKLALHITWIFNVPVNIRGSLDILIFSVWVILLARLLFFRLLNERLPWAIGKPAAPQSTPFRNSEEQESLQARSHADRSAAVAGFPSITER
jgi:hypothetical protein